MAIVKREKEKATKESTLIMARLKYIIYYTWLWLEVNNLVQTDTIWLFLLSRRIHFT